MLLSETQLNAIFESFGDRTAVVKRAYLDAAVAETDDKSFITNPYDSHTVAAALGGLMYGNASNEEVYSAAGQAFKTLLGITHESETALLAKGLM